MRAGYAWWYREYAKKMALYEAYEREARFAKRGLWRDPRPVAPWEYRRRQREAAQRRREGSFPIF